MIFKKQTNKTPETTVDLKQEQIFLANKAEKIAHNVPPTKTEQIVSGKGDVVSAISNLKKWSKDNKFEEKTKDYLQLLTDGTVEFFDGLIKEK